jgi:hypothetical protein
MTLFTVVLDCPTDALVEDIASTLQVGVKHTRVVTVLEGCIVGGLCEHCGGVVCRECSECQNEKCEAVDICACSSEHSNGDGPDCDGEDPCSCQSVGLR